MRKSFLAGVLGIAFATTVLLPEAAWACRCVARSQVAASRAADAIVLATILQATDRSELSRIYRVDILRGWKQRLTGRIDIASERTSCMSELAKGRQYLVYLEQTANGYKTDACAGNLPANHAATAIRRIRRSYR